MSGFMILSGLFELVSVGFRSTSNTKKTPKTALLEHFKGKQNNLILDLNFKSIQTLMWYALVTCG